MTDAPSYLRARFVYFATDGVMRVHGAKAKRLEAEREAKWREENGQDVLPAERRNRP